MNAIRRLFTHNANMNNNRSQSITPPFPPHQQEEAAANLQPHPPTTTTSDSKTHPSWTLHASNLALLSTLSAATPHRRALPTELILQILDHPSRWVPLHSVHHPPSCSNSSSGSTDNPEREILRVRNSPSGIPVLYTQPIGGRGRGWGTGGEVSRVRKVVLEFRGRDQGWSSFPDRGSWSWFEVSLARLSDDDDGRNGREEVGEDEEVSDEVVWTGPYEWVGKWLGKHAAELENQPRYQVQTNRHAEMTPESYVVELTGEHELVQKLRERDRVVLWACACYPGWENRVYEAKITVLGFDDLNAYGH